MSKNTEEVRNNLNVLVEDVRALMTATANVAEEKVVDARKRISVALEKGRDVCSTMSDKTKEKAKVADQAVREHPYQTLGIAFGVGALLGYLMARQPSESRAEAETDNN